MPIARRFPPPWTLGEANDACFIVRDANGQALGYFYFEDDPGRRTAASLLTKEALTNSVPRAIRCLIGLFWALFGSDNNAAFPRP